MEQLAKRNQWVCAIHPLVKLFLTVFYIVLAVSFSKYQLAGLLCMLVYPLFVFQMAELSFFGALKRLRIVLPLVCLVGIFNPFFDREIVMWAGPVGISGGVLSMLTLMLKAVFTVLASYLLIATTAMEELCHALSLLHVPKIFIVELMLIYRYLTVLLKEAGRVTDAYRLRAPGQKGIAFKAWGPLLGQLLLRSYDRAEGIYQSMCLRGFKGQFYSARKGGFRSADFVYLLAFTTVLSVLRFLPVAEIAGRLVL